ncbi:hypothetical protein SEA_SCOOBYDOOBYDOO_14 [Mycobacterium phage ScoobyDoobyDoo]|nr:hypothetical protein SEA_SCOOBYDOOBYDOO_14 [Mycobacterium phage ScoobyDoobyDoo]
MKRTIVVAAAAGLLLSGCGLTNHHAKWFPWTVPEQGEVKDHSYHPAWTEYHPGGTTCDPNGTNCRFTPPSQTYHPERWELDLYDLDGDHGWRQVDPGSFERCAIGDWYPDCGHG